MCGIAGLILKPPDRPEEADIRRMTDLVAHRGPDGSGHCIWKNVALGHRRLAILDLSEAGHQPMSYADGRYVITYNGEIYNYIELREQLLRAGYMFQSQTDTEVILAAFDFWGEKCLERFNGMWAFALLDKQEHKLFCARDRFGIKPFYFIDTGQIFAFGSEIKQLLGFLPKVDVHRETLLSFFLLSCEGFGRHTFFEGVERLRAGHKMWVDLRTGRTEVNPYYDLKPTDLDGASDSELQGRYLDLLESAICMRLRSDVPVGTCLSGGLDSSSIASIASEQYRGISSDRFTAITAITGEPETDESRFAAAVVQASNLRWLTVKPTAQDLCKLDDQLIYHQEEPFASGSILMQYEVMKTARMHRIPVLLDGQGADESLLGYLPCQAALVAHYVARGQYSSAVRTWREIRNQESWNKQLETLMTSTSLLFPHLANLYYSRRSGFIQSRPNILPVLRSRREAIEDMRLYQTTLIQEMSFPSLLRYEDKNSMAFSIEARLPFLDYRLVEFSLGLPVTAKIRNGWRKWILRKAMTGRLPDSIAWRKGKLGFAAPDRQWQESEKDRIETEILSCDILRSMIDEKKLRAMLPKLGAWQKWRLYFVARWARTFQVGERTTYSAPAVECIR